MTLFGASWIAISIETTGSNLQQDRIIEIAAVQFDPGERGRILDTFHRLCNPGSRIAPVALACHGITEAEVAGCPPISYGLYELAGWLSQFDTPVLCAHNAEHDRDFLARQAVRQRLVMPHRNWFCTLAASRAFFPARDRHTLTSLHRQFCLPAGGLELLRQRALPEARARAEVASAFLMQPRVTSFESLRALKAVL